MAKNESNLWDEKYIIGTKDGCSKSIKVIDPITNMRINIPIRGKYCNHWDVLDLENYLLMYSDKWEQ